MGKTPLHAGGAREKKRVAGVTTEYRDNSHAEVILGKILEGFDQAGGPGPDLELVSLYVDQVPESDLSRTLAAKYGFRLATTIEDALTLGSGDLAVEGIFLIGEHGRYDSDPETGQVMYPRRRFFDETAAVLRRAGRAVPVFNDKHLAYAWTDARHMYDTARELQIPFMAGSSLPLCWRDPPLTIDRGCRIEEALMLGYGPHEGYGFHALEGMQCMLERRLGGETGVAAVEALTGDAIWQAAAAGRWSRTLLDVCLARVPVYREGKVDELLMEDAAWFLIEYRDGTRATLAMANGATAEFAFAARLAGEAEPVCTWMRTQEKEPFAHFAYLLRAIEEMIHTGRPSYPVERTLLTTGVLDAMMHSLAAKERRETPELDVRYEAVDWPFAEGVPG